MKLGEVLERTVPPLGFELVDWESTPGGRHVRVFIDKPGGVDVEDCARVSHHLTRLFAVEGVDFGRLEVSSPGLDRPLTKPADFARYAGEEVELRLFAPVDNARRWKGVLRGMADGAIVVETPQGERSFPMLAVAKVRLVPKIDWRSPR